MINQGVHLNARGGSGAVQREHGKHGLEHLAFSKRLGRGDILMTQPVSDRRGHISVSSWFSFPGLSGWVTSVDLEASSVKSYEESSQESLSPVAQTWPAPSLAWRRPACPHPEECLTQGMQGSVPAMAMPLQF